MTLEVRNLTVHRGPCPVVDGVSFTAAAGRVRVIMGPNGAGKSTLLRGLLGLLPSGGTITLDGQDTRRLEPQQRARRLAYVPQRSQLNAGLSVRSVVAQGRFPWLGALARLGDRDRAEVDAALATCDAAALGERPFTQLSAGEQQRVLLARALASGAPAILLDEPTAALDVGHALALIALLRSLAAGGRIVVAVLHEVDEVHRAADDVLLLHRGRAVVDAPVAEALTAGHLRPTFGVEPVPGGAWGVRL